MSGWTLDYSYKLASRYWPGLPREDFDSFIEGHRLLGLEWADMVGPEERLEDVERFYHEGFSMLFEHLGNMGPPGMKSWDSDRCNITVKYLERLGARSLIDVGTGIASLPLAAAKMGLAAAFLEKGQTYAFAHWRVIAEGLRAPDAPIPGKIRGYWSIGQAEAHLPFAAVVALDVLEHIPAPVDELDRWIALLPPKGGVLVMSRHSFKAHPSHLRETFWLQEGLDEVLADRGFRQAIHTDAHYGIGAWVKKA